MPRCSRSVKQLREALGFWLGRQPAIARRHLARGDLVVDADPCQQKSASVGQVLAERVETQAGLLHVRPVAVDAMGFDKRLDPSPKRGGILAARQRRRTSASSSTAGSENRIIWQRAKAGVCGELLSVCDGAVLSKFDIGQIIAYLGCQA